MEIKDLTSYRHSLPDGLIMRTVGWLGPEVPSTGRVPDECVDRLVLAYETKRMVPDPVDGWHDCEVCEAAHLIAPNVDSTPIVRWGGREVYVVGHGHFLVQLGLDVYQCPVLAIHYIVDHGYAPPSEFVHAVMEGEFVTEEELYQRYEESYEDAVDLLGPEDQRQIDR